MGIMKTIDAMVTDQLCNPAITFTFDETAPTTTAKAYSNPQVGFELSNDGTNSIGIRLKFGNNVIYEKEVKAGEVMQKWTSIFDKIVIDNPNNVPFRLDVMG